MIPFTIGVAAVTALVIAVNPRDFANAASRFQVTAIPLVVSLGLGYYLLQGVRWHFLLRAVGIRIGIRETVLLNLAGQSTGLLPLGELTRAVLVCETKDAELGGVIATITVQELIYTLIIIAAALPGALEHHAAFGGILSALVATILVFVILTVPAVFRVVHAVVKRTPLLRHYVSDVEELQRDTVVLLRRWDTLGWSVLSVAGALMAISLFWLVVHSLQPGFLSWQDAAFIYAVSHIAGAITFSPGGLGSFEASTVGLLVAIGAPVSLAAAAALLERGADKGLATVAGIVAFLIARSRYQFRGLSALSPTGQQGWRDRARAAARES
jgi:glycosyltransferase 2 family protein